MLLQALSEAIGVSGDEGAIRKLIAEALKDHVSDVQVDSIGNLTALKRGSGKHHLRVMVAAHMDEIGFMVTSIDNDGFIRFTNVGGVDDRILPGLRVKIGEKQVPGVIMWSPIHLNREQKVAKLKDLRIDIGASNKAAAEGKIKRGDRIAFDSFYAELSADIVRGKAFDDRVGCSLLVDVLQSAPYGVDVLAAFTVQEEIGLRGAQIAAQRLKPDVALVLEGTTAHDIPDPLADPDDITRTNPGCKLGAGPVLTVMDRSMITQPRLLNVIRRIAENHGIPYQLKTALGGGTDAGQIHLTHGGIPSAVISMPCRYIHSPAAYLNKQDYAQTLKLIQAVLNEISAESIQQA